jgi:hypothetical protein
MFRCRSASNRQNFAVMRPRLFLLCLLAAPLAGCLHVSMDPIQVNATVDVNVKLDRALNDVFGDLDRKDPTINTPPAK